MRLLLVIGRRCCGRSVTHRLVVYHFRSGGLLAEKRGWCPMADMSDLKELMVRMELMRRFTLPQFVLMRHEHEIGSLLARAPNVN